MPPTDVRMELVRKANVARAVADAMAHEDNPGEVTLGRANILEGLADDLDRLATNLEAGGGEA